MEIIEKQLESLITLDNSDELISRGLSTFPHQFLHRQVSLGSYGIADLVAVSSSPGRNDKMDFQIVIYELKKDEIGMSALGQVCRYRKAFEDYFELRMDANLELICVLIGSDIEHSSNFIYAAADIDGLTCYKYTFDITGLHFEEIHITNLAPASFHEKGFGSIETIVQD